MITGPPASIARVTYYPDVPNKYSPWVKWKQRDSYEVKCISPTNSGDEKEKKRKGIPRERERESWIGEMKGVGGPLLCIGDLLSDLAEKEEEDVVSTAAAADRLSPPSSVSDSKNNSLQSLDLTKLFQVLLSVVKIDLIKIKKSLGDVINPTSYQIPIKESENNLLKINGYPLKLQMTPKVPDKILTVPEDDESVRK